MRSLQVTIASRILLNIRGSSDSHDAEELEAISTEPAEMLEFNQIQTQVSVTDRDLLYQAG